MKPRILHVTVSRELTAGQANQLLSEYKAAKILEHCEWTTKAYHDGEQAEKFIHTIPRLFRGQFRRKLFAWLVVLRFHKSYDHVLLRHVTFDPFSVIFAPMISNRCSVHHAKESEELRLIRGGLLGIAASWLESISAKFSVSHSKVIFGVTLEIANYERIKYSQEKPICQYPNGILPADIRVLPDKRSQRLINAAFICGTFSPWHGLDKIISACYQISDPSDCIIINLIGNLSPEQIISLSAIKLEKTKFKVYQHLSQDEYIPILEKCDFGIASLAMSRQGLTEGSTLKVREMLAMGLPVYSGHNDIALPAHSEYVFITQEPSIQEMIAFGWRCKSISRQYVREQSLPFIDKSSAMHNVVKFLQTTK